MRHIIGRSFVAFQQFKEGVAAIADVLAANAARSIRAVFDGEVELVNRKSVSGNYSAVLGVPPRAE